MGSFSDDDEEYRFFDAHENVASVSDSCSGCQNCHDSTSGVDNCISSSFQYDVWVRSPRSVRDRRRKFLGYMGLSVDRAQGEGLADVYSDADVLREEIDRIMESSGAVLGTPILEDEFSSSRSSVSSWSTDPRDSLSKSDSSVSCVCRTGDPDGGFECNVDKLMQDGKVRNFEDAGLDQLLKSEEFENSSGLSSPVVQPRLQRDVEVEGHNVKMVERVKRRWLSRLRSMTCVMNRQREDDNLRTNGLNPVQGTRVRRVKVRHFRKRLKELSALFMGQDIQAHEGAILSMKFSLDGQYLATAGEDKIVRVWQVVEDERSSENDIPDRDPSCIYFAVNHLSELAPLVAEKEKISKLKSLRKTADSACIIFPPKVFRIIETPLHIFRGHSGEILDISWSKNNCLLSSSVDKTVRLWQVGCDQCLKFFPHNNYVTCVQFNPVDDDYFVSGSIDGKVRIWGISDCQVVDWIDLRDIVTAVSYSPDGQGGIVGSIMGTCRFFSVSGNRLQVEAQICLNSKKKSPGKRITGFQFFPQDPSKVMVTCADSQVRILSGFDVIMKYKGLRNGGNYSSASVTSNGKYIISASEDCNVYVWNCTSLEESSLSRSKSVRSFECFSTDASIAIPWCGLNVDNSRNQLHGRENSTNVFPFSLSTSFSLAQDFCLESMPKGSATWPEEKLPTSGHRHLSSPMCKSQYKFFKTSCQNLSSSHAWGLVIVTAGWDGRIRSFHNYGLPVPL